MAAAVGAQVGSWAWEQTRREARELVDDPVLFLIEKLRFSGYMLIGSGVAMGVIGYFLQAAAIASAKQDTEFIQSLGTLFGNIKPLTFTPASGGTAPLSWSWQGFVNFWQDAGTDVVAGLNDLGQIAADIGTLGYDIGVGIVDVAQAIISIVTHFPKLFWNALVWFTGGSLALVLNFVFPYLIIFGAIALVASFILSAFRTGWQTTLRPAYEKAQAEWASRQRERIWQPAFDRLFHNPPSHTIRFDETPIPGPSTASDLSPVPPTPETPKQNERPEAPAMPDVSQMREPDVRDVGDRSGSEAERPGVDVAEPAVRPLPAEPVTSAELGTELDRARDRLKAALRKEEVLHEAVEDDTQRLIRLLSEPLAET